MYSNNNDQDSPSVIIVGAGASGIAAASKLLQNGFENVTILEAEDRIGGRVHTTQFRDNPVDLGAQWVHGEVGNVAFQLASPLGLLDENYSKCHHQVWYDSSGMLINQAMTDDILKFYEEIGKKVYEMKITNKSIGESFTEEFQNYFEEHPFWKKKTKGVLHSFEMEQLTNEGADSWYNVSTTQLTEYEGGPGENLINWRERSYGTILDILMKRYPNPEEELPVIQNTVLNTEVFTINNKDGKVTVTTTKGDIYTADHVIFTPSLGVLKAKYSTLFQPPLPEEKVKTIKALGYGSQAKLFLYYEEPWWTNETVSDGLKFIWNNKDIEQLEKDPEKRWLLGITEFIFVEHKPKLLLGWITGKYAQEMEKLSDQQVLNHSVEVLQRFGGKYFNVTAPNAIMRSMWNSKQNFRGAYSYRTMEADAENASATILAEPIGEKNPVILFAGEGTSHNHVGIVHGAIETGWREADRLIKLYPNLKPQTSTAPASSSIIDNEIFRDACYTFC